jgi:hypothetical protein
LLEDLTNLQNPDTDLIQFGNDNFVGRRIPKEIAQMIAKGEINPFTLKSFTLIGKEEGKEMSENSIVSLKKGISKSSSNVNSWRTQD